MGKKSKRRNYSQHYSPVQLPQESGHDVNNEAALCQLFRSTHNEFVLNGGTTFTEIHNQGNTNSCSAISAAICLAIAINGRSLDTDGMNSLSLGSIIVESGQLLAAATRLQGILPDNAEEIAHLNDDGRLTIGEGQYMVSSHCPMQHLLFNLVYALVLIASSPLPLPQAPGDPSSYLTEMANAHGIGITPVNAENIQTLLEFMDQLTVLTTANLNTQGNAVSK